MDPFPSMAGFPQEPALIVVAYCVGMFCYEWLVAALKNAGLGDGGL